MCTAFKESFTYYDKGRGQSDFPQDSMHGSRRFPTGSLRDPRSLPGSRCSTHGPYDIRCESVPCTNCVSILKLDVPTSTNSKLRQLSPKDLFFLGGARIQADKSNCCRNLIATFLILDSCALQTCDLESLSSILRTISSSWAPRRVDT